MIPNKGLGITQSHYSQDEEEVYRKRDRHQRSIVNLKVRRLSRQKVERTSKCQEKLEKKTQNFKKKFTVRWKVKFLFETNGCTCVLLLSDNKNAGAHQSTRTQCSPRQLNLIERRVPSRCDATSKSENVINISKSVAHIGWQTLSSGNLFWGMFCTQFKRLFAFCVYLMKYEAIYWNKGYLF